MTTQEVADRLVELCRQGQFKQAQEELFSENIVSIEPGSPKMPRVEGLQAIIAKGEQFQSMIEEQHGGSVSDPLVAGAYFSVTMMIDVTMKDAGRMAMDEICAYEVRDGKVVTEYLFY